MQRPVLSPEYPQGQGFIAFLPVTCVSLKLLIPKPYDFEPKSLGEHIRKRRLEKGQLQKESAKELGVNTWTVLNWERGHTEPPIGAVPAIIQFLGYDPFPAANTVTEHLLAKRRAMGWTIKEAAKVVGVGPGTSGNWERGKTILYRRHRALIARMLGLSSDAFDQEMGAHWSQLHERKL